MNGILIRNSECNVTTELADDYVRRHGRKNSKKMKPPPQGAGVIHYGLGIPNSAGDFLAMPSS